MSHPIDYRALLETAVAEARQGLAEAAPIGAALFDRQGNLLGRGHNRRVQEGDPSVHGETDAFRKAGRQRSYRDTIMVTTLAPCWYCSGLVRQFNIGAVVVGESVNFRAARLAARERRRGDRSQLGGVHRDAGRLYRGAPRGLERGYRGGLSWFLKPGFITISQKMATTLMKAGQPSQNHQRMVR